MPRIEDKEVRGMIDQFRSLPDPVRGQRGRPANGRDHVPFGRFHRFRHERESDCLRRMRRGKRSEPDPVALQGNAVKQFRARAGRVATVARPWLDGRLLGLATVASVIARFLRSVNASQRCLQGRNKCVNPARIAHRIRSRGARTT
jgi:hypothetical protein